MDEKYIYVVPDLKYSPDISNINQYFIKHGIFHPYIPLSCEKKAIMKFNGLNIYLFIRIKSINTNSLFSLFNTINTDKITKLSIENVYDLSLLSKFNFINLEEIYISSNDNTCGHFKIHNMNKLNRIYIHHSKLFSMNLLNNCNFIHLTELSFANNNISDISVLKTCVSPNLKYLNLDNNKISDISVLIESNFPNLAFLRLINNNISNILPLICCNFPKIEKIDIVFNPLIKEFYKLPYKQYIKNKLYKKYKKIIERVIPFDISNIIIYYLQKNIIYSKQQFIEKTKNIIKTYNLPAFKDI